MNTTHDSDFERLLGEFFAELCPPQRVIDGEGQGLDAELWEQVTEMGLALIGIDEAAGGAGGTAEELVVALRALGASAAPVPLAETATANWAFAAAGMALPDPETVSTLAALPASDLQAVRAAQEGSARISGTFPRVPWGRDAGSLAVVLPSGEGHALARISTAAAEVSPGTDLAGQPSDTLTFDGAHASLAPWPAPPQALSHRFMLARAAQMSGAMESIAALTRQYVTTREQFGRPLGKFQSVQAHIVHLEQMSTMSTLAVHRAGRAFDAGDPFVVVMAKSLLNDNARIAARAAHQAHGAMGMTREYRLQLYTRRLNVWRAEAGATKDLAPTICERVGREGLAGVVAVH